MSLRNTKIFNVTRAEKVGKRIIEGEFREEGGLVPSQGGHCRSSSMRLLTFKWSKEPLQGDATVISHYNPPPLSSWGTEFQDLTGHSQPDHHRVSGTTTHCSSVLLRTVDGWSFCVPFKTSSWGCFQHLDYCPENIPVTCQWKQTICPINAFVSVVSIHSSFEHLVAWLLEIVIPFLSSTSKMSAFSIHHNWDLYHTCLHRLAPNLCFQPLHQSVWDAIAQSNFLQIMSSSS